MRKLVKIGVASLMVCGILATTNALAVWVEGGQWNYGVENPFWISLESSVQIPIRT
ncbi:bacteriocin, putative [Streptococcus pneumoniae]|nr:bacteriocin, putative [Streptococcus pneumoniae]